MTTTPDAAETYLEYVMAGDTDGLLAGFAGEPDVDEPMAGRVRGRDAVERFTRERQAWFTERSARIEPIRTTRSAQRSVYEALVYLALPGGDTELPMAVVGDQAGDGRVTALRVYHSFWPLEGGHRVRQPLLPLDPSLTVQDVIHDYQRALAEGDVEAIVDTFEDDGYFREPAGGPWVYYGRQKLHAFMRHLLGKGGIKLEHCTVTDDGVACAIEFNAVQFGPLALTPQAGVAVYERGLGGRLHAARIYDDVNVEAMAGGDA